MRCSETPLLRRTPSFSLKSGHRRLLHTSPLALTETGDERASKLYWCSPQGWDDARLWGIVLALPQTLTAHAMPLIHHPVFYSAVVSETTFLTGLPLCKMTIETHQALLDKKKSLLYQLYQPVKPPFKIFFTIVGEDHLLKNSLSSMFIRLGSF